MFCQIFQLWMLCLDLINKSVEFSSSGPVDPLEGFGVTARLDEKPAFSFCTITGLPLLIGCPQVDFRAPLTLGQLIALPGRELNPDVHGFSLLLFLPFLWPWLPC